VARVGSTKNNQKNCTFFKKILNTFQVAVLFLVEFFEIILMTKYQDLNNLFSLE